ncbi:hypothetical protein [Clostridium niameyense]|uniref:hypothetical protein n=1 Tax=Clostridium niameyense TaxID=1622073 RepID=UPI00067EB836|nr:hypothetical protein [Clostridium niameyense]
MKVHLSCIQDILKLTKASNISIMLKDKIYVVANEIKDNEFKGQIVISSDAASYEDEGQTLINRDVLKLVPKGTLVTVKEDVIVAGNRKIKYPKNDIIHEPIKVENYLTTIPAGELKHLLSGYYAMSTTLARPILCGMCINGSDFIALDGYRLEVRKGNFEVKEQVVMDLSMVNTLKKIKYDKDVEVYYNYKYVKFKFGDLEVIGNRLEGNYIKYNQIIPENCSTSVEIETKPIVDILKDYKKNKFELVKLNFETNKLIISASNEIASIEDKVCIKLQGEPLKIAFNVNYLIDALKDYKVATLELTARVNPMLIKADNKLDLVLPVRIRD